MPTHRWALKAQQKEAEQNAMKMAELHSLWGKEQDALKRADYEAVMGRVDKARALQAEALKLRQQFDQVKASTTSAEAAAKKAQTDAETEARLAEAQKQTLPVDIAYKRALAGQAGKPGEFEQRVKLAKENPNLYSIVYGDKSN
jgi:FKBP-type peptidyl-prolyl cis-trans isomerase